MSINCSSGSQNDICKQSKPIADPKSVEMPDERLFYWSISWKAEQRTSTHANRTKFRRQKIRSEKNYQMQNVQKVHFVAMVHSNEIQWDTMETVFKISI